MKLIPVAIVEDHTDLRNSLKLILNTSPGFTVVGCYDRCETLLEELEDTVPQVILMDIGLPGMSGIEGVRQVKKVLLETHILMLTIYEDDAQVFQAVCAGADGYLLKKSSPIDILQAYEITSAIFMKNFTSTRNPKLWQKRCGSIWFDISTSCSNFPLKFLFIPVGQDDILSHNSKMASCPIVQIK